MSKPRQGNASDLWSQHHAEWRDPAQIASQWQDAARVEPRLLQHQATGAWWEVLESTGVTLLVTREYEHLAVAIHVQAGKPSLTYMSVPHPSGLAIDTQRQVVYLASTRNPNQIYELAPVSGQMPRLDVRTQPLPPEIARPLLPVRSRFLPGCFYLHDLALVGGVLHANSVGQNAVIRFDPDGSVERAWWPRCIETRDGPVFGQNHLQLNSIAAGVDLASSYFSASTDRLSARRPGHQNFPVDRRGVIFAGDTRQPIAHGLTRPHSARLHQGKLWVDNSGYGELGFIEAGQFAPLARLPGWTRGLRLHGEFAFVGTSRVLPRFQQYAPGLDLDSSQCALHAVDLHSGEVLGSLTWPYGNQIFAIELAPGSMTTGFPFQIGTKGAASRTKTLFYTFLPSNYEKDLHA
ncbi:MAG: DUF4915 domain-containing protein [Chloroflexota bacterium]